MYEIVVTRFTLLVCLPLFVFFYFLFSNICVYQAHYSTGAVAAGFTSTVMMPETTHEPAILDENIVRYQRIKKKG